MIGSCVEISGPRMRAWVQIPLLTANFFFSPVGLIKVAWPSGLRRWFKAPVSSEAWVRIPPLPELFSSENIYYLSNSDAQGMHSH